MVDELYYKNNGLTLLIWYHGATGSQETMHYKRFSQVLLSGNIRFSVDEIPPGSIKLFSFNFQIPFVKENKQLQSNMIHPFLILRVISIKTRLHLEGCVQQFYFLNILQL